MTGDNNGYTVAASFRRWIPVGRFSAMGFYVGTTYGSSDYMDTYFSVDSTGAADSGLDMFSAKSGIRDVRVSAIYIQPISRNWQVGGGFLFSRLLNDAADSPIVSDRGIRNQLAFGIGVSTAF
jgi:outer membrane protein